MYPAIKKLVKINAAAPVKPPIKAPTLTPVFETLGVCVDELDEIEIVLLELVARVVSMFEIVICFVDDGANVVVEGIGVVVILKVEESTSTVDEENEIDDFIVEERGFIVVGLGNSDEVNGFGFDDIVVVGESVLEVDLKIDVVWNSSEVVLGIVEVEEIEIFVETVEGVFVIVGKVVKVEDEVVVVCVEVLVRVEVVTDVVEDNDVDVVE